MLGPQEHELFQTSVREPATPQIEEDWHGILSEIIGTFGRFR